MKKLLLLLLSATAFFSNAQKPCGTAPGKAPWLQAFQKNKAAYRTASDTLLIIPMTIHNVGGDNGQGHFATEKLLDAFCTLNQDFEEANIIFYMPDGIKKIDNTSINSHDDYGYAGRFMNNVADTNSINTFFVSDPNGNCGYNLFWSHMMVSKGCAGPNDHTWAHEAGHHFLLPHPFLGWEGGQTHDDSRPPVFNQSAPEYVTYNYGPFLGDWGDTLLIDTSYVEKIDGSNCYDSADGFCDTKPDYIADRWNCNNDMVSSEVQTDPNGEKFQSDGTLIMSYSDDRCARRFSPEQIAAMRALLLDRHSDFFINPETPLEPITQDIEIIYPLTGENVPVTAVELQWESVEHATDYLVQVSRLPSFPAFDLNEELTGTSISVDGLSANRTYYWRVRAYNKFHTCSAWTPAQSFKTTEVSAVAKIAGSASIKVFPSPIRVGETLTILAEVNSQGPGNLMLTNLSGKIMANHSLDFLPGEYSLEIPINDITSGLYILKIQTPFGNVTEKILIQ